MERLGQAVVLGGGKNTQPKSYNTASGLHIVAACDEGIGRDENQDRVVLTTEGVAVIDAMGGLADGRDTAERIAVSLVQNRTNLRAGLLRAHEELTEKVLQTKHKTGAAVTTAQFGSDTAEMLWLGDTRWIHRRKHSTKERFWASSWIPVPNRWRSAPEWTLSKGHTIAQELADKGVIGQEEIDTHQYANTLTRFVGGEGFDPSAHTLRLVAGDRLLLCSDGIDGNVPPEELITLATRLSLEDLLTEVWRLSISRMQNHQMRKERNLPVARDNRSFVAVERIRV